MNKIFDSVCKKYGLNIQMNDYIKLALTHSSYANEHNLKSNERLEFLGDSILGFKVAEYLYENFPNLPEGEMSKLRATYVCEDANMKYARALSIDKMLMLGNGEEESGGRERTRNLNCAFEAFLAAVYLTGGIDEVMKILKVEVFPHITASDNVQFIDYKSQLQEMIQAESRSALVYELVNEVGPAHDRTFTFKVIHDGIVLGQGTGKKKKDAQQLAAKSALEKMAL